MSTCQILRSSGQGSNERHNENILDQVLTDTDNSRHQEQRARTSRHVPFLSSHLCFILCLLPHVTFFLMNNKKKGEGNNLGVTHRSVNKSRLCRPEVDICRVATSRTVFLKHKEEKRLPSGQCCLPQALLSGVAGHLQRLASLCCLLLAAAS